MQDHACNADLPQTIGELYALPPGQGFRAALEHVVNEQFWTATDIHNAMVAEGFGEKDVDALADGIADLIPAFGFYRARPNDGNLARLFAASEAVRNAMDDAKRLMLDQMPAAGNA